jgi:tRNA nucleotidyltransferase (CCA-adding enzyme)
MKAAHVKLITDAGGRVYEVGGAVRDRFIGEAEGVAVEPKDRDFMVTGIPMEDLEALLRTIGHVDLVGKSFGVLKFRPEGKDEVLDIALPRKEKSTGEGHRDFEVEFDHTLDILDDLGRRDFTINAIADDLESGEVIDPYKGLEDIMRHRIHIVFPAAFEEDPLRMLRAVQFAARFKFRLSDETMASIRKNAEKIKTISGERVYEELKKIMLKAEFPSIAFKLMKSTGLLKHVIPELQATIGVSQPAKFHDQDVFGHIMAAVDSAPSTKLKVRMAALFHDIAKPQTRSEVDGVIHFYQHEHAAIPVVKQILRRLRAPEDLIDDVVKLVGNHMFEATFDMSRRAIRRLIRRVGEDLIYDLIDLRVGDRIASGKPFLGMGRVGRLREIVAKELAEPVFDLKHLKLDGHDLIEMGLKPGPQFKEILRGLLEQVMDEPGLNEKDKLQEIVKEKYVEAE